MSAPHPKAQDDGDPASLRLFKPYAPGPRHCIAITDVSPESEPIPINLSRLEEELSIDRLEEIAKLMRILTWREMMDLSEAWNTPADTLHKWSNDSIKAALAWKAETNTACDAIRAETIEECDNALSAAGYPIDHLARETIRALGRSERKSDE